MKIIILILFLLALISVANGIDDNDNTSLVGHKVDILNPYCLANSYHDFKVQQVVILDEKEQFVLVNLTVGNELFFHTEKTTKMIWIQRNWIYSIDF